MSENTIQLTPVEGIINVQNQLPNTLRFQHRIPYEGITILAKDVKSDELKRLKSELKTFVKRGREIQGEQKILQREEEKLKREIERLNIELSDVKKLSVVRDAEIVVRLGEIDLLLNANADAIQALSDKNEGFVDEQSAFMSDVIRTHVVGAQWKEGDEEKFAQEFEFESRKAQNEVTEILLGLSTMTDSQRGNLKAR